MQAYSGITSTKQYQRAVRQAVTRYQAENARENKPITLHRLRSIMRRTVMLSRPGLAMAEADALVEQLLPLAMKSYEGSVQTPPTKTVTARDLYEAERKRKVRANGHRR